MSIPQEIRTFLNAHPGKKYNNAALREALGTDNATAVSVALNQLHNNKEISRAKGAAGGGFFYWVGDAPANTPRLVNGKDAADDDAEATPTMPASTVKDIERVLDAAESGRKKKSKNAGPKQSRVAKPPKKAKRKYTRDAPPQPLPVPAVVAAPAATQSPAAVFAVRDDGEIGILMGKFAVSLPSAEVKRLQAFLKTVQPLWSNE